MVKVTRETVIRYMLGAAAASLVPLNLLEENKYRSTYLVVEGMEIPYRMEWLKKGDRFTLYNPDGTKVSPEVKVLIAVEDAYYDGETGVHGVRAVPAAGA